MQTKRWILHYWALPLPYNTYWKVFKLSPLLQKVRSRFLAQDIVSSFFHRSIC